ncbi:VanZ family protein [Mesorhizobium sp. RP14(2022)]|uniref:VanZ family protein n=1 Tax=Mesorhizobium liriopis TaxID=2953882 RepID=A0ABT1C386_9HYPH|nr:VanZ family protein [Mesorhizobium liriopis]MCO6049108.1 VanZ family protein [Mesorhizobium liriopis]
MGFGLQLAAWCLLALVAAVTIGPIGLRPHVGPVGIERSLAFLLLGIAFALAYPRRPWLAVLVVAAGAGILEGLQTLVPERHGQWSDLGVKIAGGLVGVMLAQGLIRLIRASQCGKP